MIDPSAIDTIPRSFRDRFHELIEEGNLNLPLLPTVASKVLELASSDAGSAAEFSDLIHRDQALAGQVLRVANSTAFARRGAIVSLKQAVTRLGLDLLSEIAMTSMLAGNIFNVGVHKELIRSVWRHSLATGSFAKEIARTGRRNVESAFLCGLLHSIGKPILLNSIMELSRETNVTISEEAVAALLELNHQKAGIMVADKWNLPQAAGAAIKFYKNYAEADRFQGEAAMTHLSAKLGELLLTPEDISEDEVRTNPSLVVLNLYPDDLEALLAKRERIQEIVDSLDQGVV